MKKIFLIIMASWMITVSISPLLWAALSQAEKENLDALKQEKTILSRTYHVDGIYKSMFGPSGTQLVQLIKSEEPELLWITGYKAVMKGASGQSDMPQEFMCHSNLDYNAWTHRKYYSGGNYTQSRLFTLSQGQFSVEFPDGFGIPVVSTEPLSLVTQVLNLNHPDAEFKVRHQVTIEYIRDKDLDKPLKPLWSSAAYGLKLLEGDKAYFGVSDPDKKMMGPGCLMGENAADSEYYDQFGRKFTGHWVVKPGREVNRTLATRLMNIPYDTTVHYIAVHLHPFAESLELRDLTENKTVFKTEPRLFDDKIGIKHVDYFSSEEGIPIYKDHQYEVVSVYNNTTDEDQDSMAVMYLYLLDKDFKGMRDPSSVE